MTKKSYAKVNVFLKITGKRGNYHTIASRFLLVKNLFDVINFQKDNCDKFSLKGDFNCKTSENTIFKAYKILSKKYEQVRNYFKTHKIYVEKKIPEFAGLGGGSSNCATFINMVNDVCALKLSKEELCNIAIQIGSDVPFFIYEYNSANVSGIGEIVEQFDEINLDIVTFTPKIKCDTKKIFNLFRSKFYKETISKDIMELFTMKSIDIMKHKRLQELNDLYIPAVYLENKLNIENFLLPKKTFFSGSGSSFFYIKNQA